VCELCAKAHGKGYASRQTITLEWSCGLGFVNAYKRHPPTQGLQNTLGFNTLYLESSWREYPILNTLKLDSRFLPPILQTFKYKVKIETAKQDTEH
jgi:hypothetical protein